jgi:hypothetical protein
MLTDVLSLYTANMAYLSHHDRFHSLAQSLRTASDHPPADDQSTGCLVDNSCPMRWFRPAPEPLFVTITISFFIVCTLTVTITHRTQSSSKAVSQTSVFLWVLSVAFRVVSSSGSCRLYLHWPPPFLQVACTPPRVSRQLGYDRKLSLARRRSFLECRELVVSRTQSLIITARYH